MAITTITGRIGFIKHLKNGFIISVAEKKQNKLQKTIWQKVAIWGKRAEAIAKHLRKGGEFEFRCDFQMVQRNGKTFPSLTVNAWCEVNRYKKPKGFQVFAPPEQSENPDDWFVPSHRDPDSRINRRYEGFENRA